MALARLAAAQHGVVTVSQLRRLGLSASGTRSRVGAGTLHRVRQGVYAVGHPALCAHGRWTAAVLACGPSAVLSHASAAAAWGLRATDQEVIDVTAPGGRGRSPAGIRSHRSRTLHGVDVTTVRGIPCTTVARTLLDLAEVVDRHALRRACQQAEVLRLLDGRALRGTLDRAAGRRGAGALRAVMDELGPEPGLTRSELEHRFLAICVRAGVPAPRVNARLGIGGAGTLEADFVWEHRRLIAETDGHATHGTQRAFERDRRRDQQLLLAGWRTVRFTWRQVTADADEVAATLRGLLAPDPPRG